MKYSNHTGRELELMLAGTKPLAKFYAEISELPEESFIPEEAFAAHVESGRFVRREMIVEGPFVESLGRPAKLKYVFFALATQAWRIDAMIVLQESFRKSNCWWNEALERIEGTLLGYTDEENDAWCKSSKLLQDLRTRSGEGHDAQQTAARDRVKKRGA